MQIHCTTLIPEILTSKSFYQQPFHILLTFCTLKFIKRIATTSFSRPFPGEKNDDRVIFILNRHQLFFFHEIQLFCKTIIIKYFRGNINNSAGFWTGADFEIFLGKINTFGLLFKNQKAKSLSQYSDNLNIT